MDITLLGPQFKGGIWHRYFSRTGMDKKDKTLNAIINEKLRYYKLYYPFLEKKQICGKAYEELGIPHICGDVNRKKLYKLYLQERKKELTFVKKSRKYKNNTDKYANLPIKNISRKNNDPKRPVFPLAVKPTQATIVTSQKRVENSKLDTLIDNVLFSSTDPRTVTAIEKTHQETFSKHTKSVRFNDGIQVHKVSPVQPMYKLKSLGRLFDEPSLVRSLNEQYHTSQETEEENFESDSEYDADTGIMSDNDDSYEDLPGGKQITPEECISENQEIIPDTNTQEIISEQTENRTTFDLPEEELYSTDSDITKEGYRLILSSKMISAAQGKWLRETEQIVEYNSEDKLSEKSNAILEDEKRSKSGSPQIIRSEIHVEQNVTIDKSLIEKIKCLQISSQSEKEVTGSQLCSIQNDRKDSLEKISTNGKIIRKSTFSNKIPSKKETNNLKISLENKMRKNLVDEEIFLVDANKLSYTEDLFSNTYTCSENNLEKDVRNISDKLLNDDSNLLDDWSSLNESTSDKKLQNLDAFNTHIESRCANTESYRNELILTDVTAENKLDFNKKLNIVNSKEIISPEKHKHNAEIIKKAKIKNQLVRVTEITEHSSPLPEMSVPLHIEETLFQRDERTIILPTTSPVVANIKNKQQFSSRTNKSDDLTRNEENFMKDNSSETQKQNKKNSSLTVTAESVLMKQDLEEISSNIYSQITKSIIIESKGFTEEDYCGSSYTKSEQLEDPTKCKLMLYKFQPSKDKVSSNNISKPYENSFLKQVMNIGDNQPENKESFCERDIFKNELSAINAEGVTNEKKGTAINELQLCNISLTAMSLKNLSLESASIINHSKDMLTINEGDIVKAFNNDQQTVMKGNQNSQETAELYEGQIIIKKEPGDMSYLSKIQMWSIKSKDYLANFPLLSETPSEIGSCNISLSERKITSTGQEENKDYGSLNDPLESSSVSEGNKSSTGLDNEVDTLARESPLKNIDSESKAEHYAGSESSSGTVRVRIYCSDEVSTAYETDPETGKLRMNRHFEPCAASTPVALPIRVERQEPIVTERESNKDYRSSAESLTCNESSDHNFEKDNNQFSTKAETKRDDFEPNFEGYLKTPNHNYGGETHNVSNPHESLLPSVTTKETLKSTKASAVINMNYKQDETNKTENKNGGFFDQQCDIDKTSSESIIENSDPDFPKKSRIIKYKYLEATSKKLATDKQKISTIINKSVFNATDQLRDSNKTLSESIIENSNSNTLNEKLTLDITGISHQDFLSSIKKEGYNEITSSSNSIIENSDSNFSYSEFPTGKDTKNLSATTVKIIQQEITSIDEINSQILVNNTDQKINKIYTNPKQDEAASSRFKVSNKNTTYDSRKTSETYYEFEPNNSETQKHDVSLDPQTLKNQPSYSSRKSHITFLIRNNDIQQSCDGETCAQSDDSLKTEAQSDLVNKLNSQISSFTPIDKSHTVNNHVFDDHDNSIISKIQRNSNSASEEDLVLTSSQTEAHKNDNMSMGPINLKRKLETINEVNHESTYSLLSDDEIIQDISSVSSTKIQSTPEFNTESSEADESGCSKINFKRINTNFRKKRAKLIKENPVKRGSTSSSEDDLKMPPQSLKIKDILLTDNSNTSQGDDQVDLEVICNYKQVKQEIGKSDVKRDTDIQRCQIANEGKSLIIKSDMKKKVHVSNNLQKLKSSDSLRNINFSRAALSESSEVEASRDEEKRPYNKIMTNTSPILEKTRSGKTPLSPSHNKKNDKSQKSFQLYQQGFANKENININLRQPKRSSTDSSEDWKNTEFKKFSAYTSNNDVIDTKRKKILPRKSEDSDLIIQNKEKNVKSSIVRWIGSSEASQIANSPEVNTLLRRTYYMGNN